MTGAPIHHNGQIVTVGRPDGVNLELTRFGPPPDAQPPVLLMHGMGSTSAATWLDSGIVEKLVDRGRHTVLLDARGHGRSSAPASERDYGMTTWIADAVAVLDQLGSDRWDLVGYSLGAAVAAHLAATDPRPRRVLLGGLARRTLEPWPITGELATFLDQLAGPEPPTTPLVERERARLAALGNDPVAVAACIRSLARTAPLDLAAVTGPAEVRVVNAEDDADPADVASAMPGAGWRRVPGSHGDAYTHPAFADAVVEFLTG